ncbi:MAG: hypothetical protein LAO09_11180 [Acidobacteriia bacterium]|nr:hypothetical protein [Terriglobia bacterium]
MKLIPVSTLPYCLLVLLAAEASAQVPPSPPATPSPVPYSSVSELNLLLSDLDQTSRNTQQDLTRLRIEKWKTDANTKRGSLADVESIQRNLRNALPEIASQLQNSPDSLVATFKLYRNLDALYDVFGSLVESAGAFGSRDEFQSLQNDLGALERSRRSFADRMEGLASAKEGEITGLRTQLQAKRAAESAPAPAKKVVVDDNEPPKKPVKKKPPVKATKPSPGTPPKPAPDAGATQPPPSTQP